jgi:NAD(P)-dependent dehydrogenase (short-subunit alcohol dehydrogenase family)
VTRRSVLVTGASKGIGAACTALLAERGWRVFAGVRSAADADALRSAHGGAVVPLLLDVTAAEQVAGAAAQIAVECDGRLDAVVNNAGIALAGPLEFLPIDELRRQLEINVIGQVAVTQAVLPMLRAAHAADEAGRAGRIVFMSSVSGRSALPFIGAYGASKFALEAVADALRLELRPFGLRVVLVEPGVIATPIWETSTARGLENLARMPPEMDEYYGAVLQAMRAWTANAMSGLPADRVARVVARALEAKRPRTRYVVGRDARARIALEALMPDRLRDWLIHQGVKRL